MTPRFVDRCKRVRHRQNECRVCVEVCPEAAISFTLGPVVNDACTGCGLCLAACPTEVFQDEVHSDQQMLDQVEMLLRPARGAGMARPVQIACAEAEASDDKAIRIPCLGSLTTGFFVGAIALGARPLELLHGHCASCRKRTGAELFAQTKDASVALIPAIGLKADLIVARERPRPDRGIAARRRFLSRVTGLGRRESESLLKLSPVAAAPMGAAGGAGPAPPSSGSPGRALLGEALRRQAITPTAVPLAYDRRFPWGSIRIKQSECAVCGTCVNVCPTGAITRTITDHRLSHHFDGSKCTNCRLCEEACPQQVISFSPQFDPHELGHGVAHPITDIALHTCEICGETLSEREGRYCITCVRRGRVDSHVPRARAGASP